MKLSFFLVTLIFFSSTVYGTDKVWTAYIGGAKELTGFKDETGAVKITPRFMGLTTATRFRNIISVMEDRNGSYESYHLLKDGRKVKPGENYVSDMSFDCESENKIRFRSKELDLVGFLGANGKVVISPVYSDARPFKNGLSSVIKNAKRMCHNDTEFSEENRCEHWRWDGGESLVINLDNEVLIENAYLKRELDLYSLTISKASSNAPDVDSLKGKNGKFYNFVNVKRNFENWLKNKFVINLDKSKLINHSYKSLTLWNESKGWYQVPRNAMTEKQAKMVISELAALHSAGSEHFVTINGLNKFIYTDKEFERYFDDCSNAMTDKYPVLELIVEHNLEDGYKQNHYSFLKTDSGYKLISFTIRTKNAQ